MVSRKSKNNLATTDDEKTKPYDSNAKNCLTRLDLIAIDSLSMLGNDRVRDQREYHFLLAEVIEISKLMVKIYKIIRRVNS